MAIAQTDPTSKEILAGWEARYCDFQEDGASSILGQHNSDNGGTRTKISHIKLLGTGIIGSVCSVVLSKWVQLNAALIVIQVEFRAKEGLLRFKNAEVSLSFEPQTQSQASPVIRSIYPETNRNSKPRFIASSSTLSTSSQPSISSIWPSNEFLVRGRKWSEKDREEPHQVFWTLNEAKGSSQGICQTVKLASVVTFSGPFQAVVDIKATTGVGIKVRNFPWSQDDPVLFDGATTKGRPLHKLQLDDLKESELTEYLLIANPSSLDVTVAGNVIDAAQANQHDQDEPPRTASASTKPNVVYRVRGIPLSYDEEFFIISLSQALDIERGSIQVRSFSENPYEYRSEMMAIVSFDSSPMALESSSTKGEWGVKFDIQHPTEGGDSKKPVIYFFDTHFIGFSALGKERTNSCENVVDIVAISGLGGHAYGSFKERGGKHMWLEDSLPASLRASEKALQSLHARLLIYGYNSRVKDEESFQTINDLALDLRASLRMIRPNEKCKRPIIFIGHSLGGLIVKQLLIMLGDPTADDMDRYNLRACSGALFFGVPNQGMDNSSLLAVIGSQPNREFVQSLSINSLMLERQVVMFPIVFSFKDSAIFSFFETCVSRTAIIEDGKLVMSGKPVVLVSKESATNSRPWEQGVRFNIPIYRDHSDLVKFERYSVDYDKVLACILELLRTSVSVIPDRFAAHTVESTATA